MSAVTTPMLPKAAKRKRVETPQSQQEPPQRRARGPLSAETISDDEGEASGAEDGYSVVSIQDAAWHFTAEDVLGKDTELYLVRVPGEVIADHCLGYFVVALHYCTGEGVGVPSFVVLFCLLCVLQARGLRPQGMSPATLNVLAPDTHGLFCPLDGHIAVGRCEIDGWCQQQTHCRGTYVSG